MGMLQQLMQMLQSLMGYGCNPPYGGGRSARLYGNERYFRNATASSDGDPHLSFDGEHWNNMTSHPDLLHSDSFAGGFRDLDASHAAERQRRHLESVGDGLAQRRRDDDEHE